MNSNFPISVPFFIVDLNYALRLWTVAQHDRLVMSQIVGIRRAGLKVAQNIGKQLAN
jgi:hypothetical protein